MRKKRPENTSDAFSSFFLQNYAKRAVRQDGSALSVITREHARGNLSFAESPRCGNSSFAENTPEVRQLGF
jgi:hypothetical protein